jgi:hypothetical protein
MSDRQIGRSKELEKLRFLLFPDLSREEGWRRIDAAFEAATDSERAERIDRLASDPDLDAELLRTLWQLGGDGST